MRVTRLLALLAAVGLVPTAVFAQCVRASITGVVNRDLQRAEFECDAHLQPDLQPGRPCWPGWMAKPTQVMTPRFFKLTAQFDF